jgi:hypothetical protein
MYLFDNPAVKICCITNNPLVKKKFPTSELYEVGIDELLMIVREKIIAGNKLLSHPLYGNIRADIGPYKSVVLDASTMSIDVEGLRHISSAYTYVNELMEMHQPISWDEDSLRDFQEVDYLILKGLLDA